MRIGYRNGDLIMIVREWLEENNRFTEATMLDDSGKEVGIWYGDDDPKYDAIVLKVEENGEEAILHTNWKGETS